MPERSCWTCGAPLGGYGMLSRDKKFYCTSACERDAWPDDDDSPPQEPEEDRDGQYDTLEERDIDRMDCPSNQFE